MSKIFESLEKAINDGNWDSVCKFYTKMTGKPISAPVIKKQFDPKTATKKQLYEAVKTKMPEIGPIKNFTEEDLRDLYDLDVEAPVVAIDNAKPAQVVDIRELNVAANPSISYVNPNKKHKIINMDKKGFNARLNDFPSYDDERKLERDDTSTRTTASIQARCVRCSRVEMVNPTLTIAGRDEGNEKAFICAKCS